MSFTPHNPSHAVQSTVFEVFFEPVGNHRAVTRADFPSGSKALAALPGTRTGSTINVTIADGVANQGSPVQGVELFLAEPDGSSAWSVQVSAAQIYVECRVYTRWRNVWDRARDYLEEALAALRNASGAEPSLDRVEMRVVDRFVADGPDYRLSDLFKECAHVPAFAFAAGPAWHSHLGWFDGAPQRVLHNLNFDAKPINDKVESGEWEISILHFQRAKLLTAPSKAEKSSALETIYQAFHRDNKALISSILSSQMSSLIGLAGEQ